MILEMINSGSKLQQTYFVKTYLKSKKVLGIWATGHITRFISIGPTWAERNDPFGLTMLRVYCSGYTDLSAQRSLQLAIREKHDKLDKDNVTLLTKKEWFNPQSVHEIRVDITTYEAILSAICTPTAIIPQMMRVWK
jgi:hypothetical protein